MNLINNQNIRKKVMFAIIKAKKEILATMDINEEQNFPLPIKYFLLLKKKQKEGVKIKRIVFGHHGQYKSFLKEVKSKNLFFTGNYTKSKNYRRMIMIDGIKLFFRKKVNGSEKFYFTTGKKYIKEYKKYFNKFRGVLK